MINNKKKFYVYAYLDPIKPGIYTYENYSFSFEPFYIGKGHGNRLNDHLQLKKLKKNSLKNNKIKKILNSNNYPIIIKVKSNLQEIDALNLEKKLIKIIGRKTLKKGPLTNLTDGGEFFLGYICSDELRKKRSENITAEKNPNFQKKPSLKSISKMLETKKTSKKWEEHLKKCRSIEGRNKMSELVKGEKNGFFGKKHSETTKQKISIHNSGKLLGNNNPMSKIENRNKVSEAKKKKVINSENKVFNSIEETAKHYAVSRKTIQNILKGKNKNNKFDLYYYVENKK
jgi:hypothetical protein